MTPVRLRWIAFRLGPPRRCDGRVAFCEMASERISIWDGSEKTTASWRRHRLEEGIEIMPATWAGTSSEPKGDLRGPQGPTSTRSPSANRRSPSESACPPGWSTAIAIARSGRPRDPRPTGRRGLSMMASERLFILEVMGIDSACPDHTAWMRHRRELMAGSWGRVFEPRKAESSLSVDLETLKKGLNR